MDAQPYRVLAIDGGGMRGLIIAELLRSLCKRKSEQHNKNLTDIGKAFDLISGTSTGGIIACALGMGFDIDEVITLYLERGEKIFPDMDGYIDTARALIKVIRNGRANGDELKDALTDLFKEHTLNDVYNSRKIALCIPVLDYTTNSPYIFKTPHSKAHMQDKPVKLVDVCMATSAAPIFFQPYFFMNDSVNKGYVDGGMWANNPVMVALIEALSECGDERPIDIVSLGFYAPNNPLSAPEKEMGVLDWTLKPMMRGKNNISNLILDAQSCGAAHTTEKMASVLNLTRKNKIRIIRWPLDQTINESDKKYMDLDSAGEKAGKIMKAYAKQQAELILKSTASPEISFIDDLFLKMEKL